MKKKRKWCEITDIIRGAIKRNGLTGIKLAEIIGMPYQTLLYRFRNPGTWKFYEWGSVLRHIRFLPDELQAIQEAIQK